MNHNFFLKMDSITVLANEKEETNKNLVEVDPDLEMDLIDKVDSNENVKKVISDNGADKVGKDEIKKAVSSNYKSKGKGNNKTEPSVKYNRIFKKVSPDGNLVRYDLHES